MSNWLDNLLFGYYPYICLAVFFIGSLLRFDRDQYTWKSDSSQLLRRGQLRLGSNLFHIGVLFLFFGHFFGMLTPPQNPKTPKPHFNGHLIYNCKMLNKVIRQLQQNRRIVTPLI